MTVRDPVGRIWTLQAPKEDKSSVHAELTTQEAADILNSALILVVNDVEETRDGLEKLLHADGYRVDPARGEEDAVCTAKCHRPALILISLGGQQREVVASPPVYVHARSWVRRCRSCSFALKLSLKVQRWNSETARMPSDRTTSTSSGDL
jgi:hypothetical protein